MQTYCSLSLSFIQLSISIGSGTVRGTNNQDLKSHLPPEEQAFLRRNFPKTSEMGALQEHFPDQVPGTPSPSVCGRVSFLVITKGLRGGSHWLSLWLSAQGHGSSARLFLLILLFARKTETTFLGRLGPTRKHSPDGIFL